MRLIKEVLVHCSDSDVASHDNIETIRQWHIDRGMVDVAYHYVITKDGICHPGRNLWDMGAHCIGHNNYSIGICLTGRSIFTRQQFDTLIAVCSHLREIFNLQVTDFYGHREFCHWKTCPNFDVRTILCGGLG